MTSSCSSDDIDQEEIQLALQAAKIATREKIRSRFHGSNDLIHRLFVCISGRRVAFSSASEKYSSFFFFCGAHKVMLEQTRDEVAGRLYFGAQAADCCRRTCYLMGTYRIRGAGVLDLEWWRIWACPQVWCQSASFFLVMPCVFKGRKLMQQLCFDAERNLLVFPARDKEDTYRIPNSIECRV